MLTASSRYKNGEWMPYGQQPENFVRIWRDVTNAVRAVTNEVRMACWLGFGLFGLTT